jgi:hypothetical protein
MLFAEDTVKTVRASNRKSLATSMQGRIESTLSEKVQNLVRNNKLKKWVLSQTQDFQQLILGQTLWSGYLTLIEDSSPQKCPGSRHWCQLFWTLSVGHQGRPTWVALWSQWVYNPWQQLHWRKWCALKFTISSASLNDTSGSKQGFVCCNYKRYSIDKNCKCRIWGFHSCGFE